MSVKIIACLNPFTNERTEQFVESCSIQNIIEKIAPALPTQTGVRVILNDEIISDFTHETKDGDTVYIRIVPEGTAEETGTGMKIGGWAAILGGVLLTIFTVGIGASFGVALIGAGVGLLAGGTVLTNIDIPEINEREKPTQDPSIRGSRNQARPLGYIPILFGRRRIYADIVSKPYTWIGTDGKQYLYQLFCCGQKDQIIDKNTFKIGETSILDYSASRNIDTILSGGDALINIGVSYGAGIPLGYRCIHDEQINAIVKNKTEEGIDGSIIRTTPDKTSEINIDIFFYNGLGKYDDKGNVVSTSVTVEAFYKKDGEADSAYQLLGYFNGSTNSISGSELKTKRYTITRSGLAAQKWTVKIRRVSTDSNDNKVVDACYVGSIRSIKNEAAVSPEVSAKITLVALRIKASEKLSQVIEEFSFTSQAKFPVYAGSGSGSSAWLSYAATDNPASAMLYALKGENVQQKISDSDIDWSAFEKYYKWCSLHKYGCNEYVAESMTVINLLQAIGSTSRAEITRLNGKLSVVQDIQREAAMQLFSPRNTKSYSESILLGDIPDAMALGFIDATTGYAENEVVVYNTPSGAMQNWPDTTQDSRLWGVTSSEQARRLGMYKYAVLKNRPIIHKIAVDFEYLMCAKGDWIKYAGDIALAGITQGRITDLIQDDYVVSGVYTDESLQMETGKQYALRIRKSNGEIILIKLFLNPPGENNQVFFETPLLIADSPQSGDLFAFGTQNNETIDLVITDIQCGDNLSADLTCVEYAPEIFGVDSPNFILPPFDSKINDVAPVVDSGMIKPSDWKNFTTYHDAKEKPDKPTVDGTLNGWHYLQTTESKWSSLKAAKNVTDGEWSVPIQTSRGLADDLINGSYPDAGVPDTIYVFNGFATREGITVTWDALSGGLRNTIQYIKIEIKKDGVSWNIYEAQGQEFVYLFDRESGEYPEREALDTWRIRIKAVNIYGKESLTYGGGKDGFTINTATYGTWLPSVPLTASYVSKRTVQLNFTRNDCYGFKEYRVQISKDGLTWYSGGDSTSAETNEAAWSGTRDWYTAQAGSQYTQVMPLTGQASGLPLDTTYYFRVASVTAVPTSANPAAVNVSAYSAAQAVLARATGVSDIVANAIGTAQLQQNVVKLDNLNVLAKNVVNSFIGGTKEGWNTEGTIVTDPSTGLPVLELITTGNPSFTSNNFDVLPDDIFCFSFGIETKAYISGSGLFLGLTVFQSFEVSMYDFTDNKWVAWWAPVTNRYFINDYKSLSRKYFKTYIAGKNVAVDKLPPPSFTDTSYTVMALRMTGTNKSCHLRTGFNATTEGTKWWFITPQIYRIGDGKVVANNIICNDLVSIAGKFGYIDTAKIQLDETNFMTAEATTIRQKDGSSYAAAAREVCFGTTVKTTGYEDTDEFFHYKPGSGFFFKIANFIVTATASMIKGTFQVFRKGESKTPVLEVQPGSSSGNESTTVRGALRVKKSQGDDTNVLEVLPNGSIRAHNFTKTDKLQFFRKNETITPVFEIDPGTNAGTEQTEIRGALRITKNTNDNSVIMEVLQNGDIRGTRFTGRTRDLYQKSINSNDWSAMFSAANGSTNGIGNFTDGTCIAYTTWVGGREGKGIINFNTGGSCSNILFESDYNGTDLKYRTIIDSNRWGENWKKIALEGTEARFSAVWGAVGNDITDNITLDEPIDNFVYGYCYCYDGTHKRGNKGITLGIASDTAAVNCGKATKESIPGVDYLPVCIGGFVLAHTDDIYPAGTKLMANAAGVLTKKAGGAKVIAEFYRKLDAEDWNGVRVGGRMLVKVV